MSIDLIVTNGTIVDGTGGDPFIGDVAIEDGKITDLGRVEMPPGTPTLDASGLYVAPGFIDIHSHSDFTLVVDLRAVRFVLVCPAKVALSN